MQLIPPIQLWMGKPTNQATEWMNRMCKMQNGIIGITRNDQARDKFCVTCQNDRASHRTQGHF